MKEISKLLEKQYKELINEKNDWHFFVKLADYAIFIKDNAELNEIVSNLLNQKKIDYQEFISKETEAKKELLKAEKKVLKIVADNDLQKESARIKRAVSDLIGYKEGHIISSEAFPEFIHSRLFEIGIGLAELNKKQLLGGYSKDNSERKNIYGNFVFSNKLKEYREELEKTKSIEKISYWNAWDKINLVWIVLYDKEKSLKQLSKEKNFLSLNLFALIDEMNQIEKSYRQPFEKRSLYYNFIREHYSLYLSRLHNYLLKELNLRREEKKRQEKKKEAEVSKKYNINLELDEDTSELILGNRSIKLKKFGKEYNVLKTILNSREFSLEDEIFFSEIAEQMDIAQSPSDKDVYNAIGELKKKIAIETGIKDFFMTTSYSLKINSIYT